MPCSPLHSHGSHMSCWCVSEIWHLEAYPDNPYRKKASPYIFGLRVLTAKRNICSNTFTKDMKKKHWPASQTDRNKVYTNPKIIVHKYTSSLNYCIGISSPRYGESWDSAYMIRADDGASPRTHKQVIAIIHSIAHSAISNTFLSPLKLFQQSEVPWNCGGISSQTKKTSFNEQKGDKHYSDTKDHHKLSLRLLLSTNLRTWNRWHIPTTEPVDDISFVLLLLLLLLFCEAFLSKSSVFRILLLLLS